MDMLVVDRDGQYPISQARQLLPQGHTDKRSPPLFKNNWRLFHQLAAAPKFVFIHPRWRRTFVIAHNVFAMMSSPKTSLVAMKPRAIGRDDDVIPLARVLIHTDASS